MAGKEFSNEERAFMADLDLGQAASGGAAWGDGALALFSADAEPLPPDVAERIRQASRAKAGLSDGGPGPGAAPAEEAPSGARGRSWRRLLAAAAAFLLALGATVGAANGDEAVAAVRRLLHLIPGYGIRETTQETLVMASPVTVQEGDLTLTVTGFVSDDKETRISIRIENIPQDKALYAGPREEPERFSLTLPDGTQLPQTGAQTSIGRDYKANLWFEALPPATPSVTLHVPAIAGETRSFAVSIPLTDVARAGLPGAQPGGWAEELHGVRIGAPDVAFGGDQITVRVQGVTADKGSRVIRIGTIGVGMEALAPTLTDDRGRTYTRDESADVFDAPGDHSLVFTGPVAWGAKRLLLRVPAVEVTQRADVILKIDLTGLPIGVATELNRVVKLGRQTVLVRSATLEAVDQLRLDLDLGPELDGVQLLRFGLEPAVRTTGAWSWSSVADPTTGQLRIIRLEPPSNADSYSVRLRDPVLRVRGPWLVELPVR